MTPPVCLLHIIDCDKMSSMGYVYEGTVRLGIKRLYKPYTHITKTTLEWTITQKHSYNSLLIESMFPKSQILMKVSWMLLNRKL